MSLSTWALVLGAEKGRLLNTQVVPLVLYEDLGGSNALSKTLSGWGLFGMSTWDLLGFTVVE